MITTLSNPARSTSSGVRPGRSARIAVALGAAALSALSACSSIRTSSHTPLDSPMTAPGPYAWRASEPATQPAAQEVTDEGRLIDDPQLVERVQRAADEQFEARGFTKVEPWTAEYHAVVRPRVLVRTESQDPYFTGSAATRYEQGTLRIDLYRARTGELVWSGAGSSRLRDAAIGFGVNTVRYFETGDERKWRVEDKAPAIFERFPLPVLR